MLEYHFAQLFGSQCTAVHGQIWGKNTSTRIHTHDFTELIIVTKGCGINQIDGYTCPMLPGDIQLIRPGSTHTFHAATELHIINLLISPDNLLFTKGELQKWEKIPAFQDLFNSSSAKNRKKNKAVVHFEFNSFQTFLRDIELLKHELQMSGPEHELLLRARLTILLGCICRTMRDSSSPKKSTLHSSMLLAKIFDILHKKVTKIVSEQMIAENLGITPQYLSNFFHAQTGLSLLKYQQIMRVNQAREMLELNPDANITEIAFACGFNDSSYFSRQFRQNTGMTPLEYRKKFAAQYEFIEEPLEKVSFIHKYS